MRMADNAAISCILLPENSEFKGYNCRPTAMYLRILCIISLFSLNVDGYMHRGDPLRLHVIGKDLLLHRRPSTSATILHCSLRNRRKQKRDEMGDQERERLQSAADANLLQALSQPANEDAPPFPVPESHREHNAVAITHPHIRFYSFDELFPESNLAEVFDTHGDFRHALRVAAREDFFMPDDRLPENANAAIKDPRSTLMSSWRTANEYLHLSAVFEQYRITCQGSHLRGPVFVATLVALCGPSPHVFGSWMDILGVKGRRVNHSWHQDSGLEQCTVMVGFPPTDRYTGLGVFSHAVKLSHRLPTPVHPNQPRLWTEAFMTVPTDKMSSTGDGVCSSDNNHESAQTVPIDSQYIVRPEYRRGREVMVYDDRDVFHSAPDCTHREAMWRLM